MATLVMPTLDSEAPWLGFAGVTWDVTRSQIHKTSHQETMTGDEASTSRWPYPLYNWRFTFNCLRDQRSAARNTAKVYPYNEFEKLWGWFAKHRGSGLKFFFTDPFDFQVTNQTITASAAAGQTVLQVVRTFDGDVSPVGGVNAITQLRVNGTPTGGITLNYPYDGFITLATPLSSGAVIAADFTYYWKVRFLKDQLDFHTQLDNRWECKTVDFKGCRR